MRASDRHLRFIAGECFRSAKGRRRIRIAFLPRSGWNSGAFVSRDVRYDGILRLDEDEDGVSRSEAAANNAATINNQDMCTIKRLDASRTLSSTGSRACADSQSF